MTKAEGRKLRCAIYTRKSSEEGLDQAFNSLDAQHEACAAFITSQSSLGWRAVAERYDDGGVSGGTMERPALIRLLKEIRDGKVDVVVVYKIDRLTRSLTDFAKIVDVFDANDVSFVSVTQQFNTTSSMGRRTLNVLLSFAQFEREVAAERIRDKVAASRRKGIWMGGSVPLGYRATGKALIVDPDRADAVRMMFRRYLDLKSVPALEKDLNADLGFLTRIGRSSMGRGPLYHLLSNVTYIGKVRHRGNVYDGQQAPIVDPETFEAAQSLLAQQAPARSAATTNATSLHLMAGILFDERGDRLSPTFTSRADKRYRYYVSAATLRGNGENQATGWRLPAHRIETIVESHLIRLLGDERQMLDWFGTADAELLLAKSKELAATWPIKSPADKKRSLAAIFARVVLRPDSLELEINVGALMWQITGQGADPLETVPPEYVAKISLPLSIRRRGQEARLIVGSEIASSAKIDDKLVALIGRAHLFLRMLNADPTLTLASLAKQTGVHIADVSRTLPLAFLSPTITKAILSGMQAPILTARTLARATDLTPLWAGQTAALGL